MRVGPDKRPLAGKEWFDRENFTPDEAAALNGDAPPAWGVKSGPVSGQLVLDLDSDGWRDSFQEVTGHPITDLPRTIAWTSGKPGRSGHLFTVPNEWWPALRNRRTFTRPWREGDPLDRDGKKTAITLWELRWDRHQSVVMGAHPETGSYRWLTGRSPHDISDPAVAPDWLLEALLIQAHPDALEVVPTAEDAARAVAMLEYIDPQAHSCYIDWLRVGMALHHTDPGLLPEWIEWCRPMPNFDEKECRAKWRSFGKGHKGRPASIATLHHLAKAGGYVEPKRPQPSAEEVLQVAQATAASGDPVGQAARASIPLSESQRFELLRSRAAQILTEHPRKVEQELAMRMAATDLELPALGPQQIRSLLWEARNGDAGPVLPLTPNQPLSLAPIPWLLEGILMAGALNLIVALPKIGKTAWALGFLGAWLHGQRSFLGCDLPPTPCPPVLIVGSDQPENDWGRMLKQFGLLDHTNRLHHRILGLFTAGRPLHLDAEGIDRITTYAEKHPGLVVLIDSLHACISPLGLKEESAEVAEPVRDLMSALEPHRATVLVIHHANKGRANDGAVAASRGSTALPAVASQMISLTRLQTGAGGPQGNKERRLVLKTEGRGGMPQELLIERTDAEGWICHGDAAAAMEAQAREKAREKLTDRQQSALRLLIQRAKAGEPTTVADAVTALDLSRQRAQDTLGALVQKRLAIKTIPTESAPDGGRPAATYIPVQDA
ncbi:MULTISPECIES: PriCT-2 domain-containing protein [unclassified Synechococcus]|uniref:PriCT-2 domain-containing protein n=1 Tax=unclassified Synechococcus TaxID=2626047 RepID=UPI001C22B206